MINLYVISADYNGEVCYKIGVTKKDVNERIKQFKTGNCSNFNIEYVFRKDSCIFTIEKRLHKLFMNKQIDGEWFLLNFEDLEKIPSICEKYYNIYKSMNETNMYMKDRNTKFK